MKKKEITLRDLFTEIKFISNRFEERFNKLDQRLDKVEQRLDRIEQRLDKIERKVGVLQKEMTILKSKVDLLNEKVDVLQKDMKTSYDVLIIIMNTSVHREDFSAQAGHIVLHGKQIRILDDRLKVVEEKSKK